MYKYLMGLIGLSLFLQACAGSETNLKDATAVRQVLQQKKQDLTELQKEIAELETLLGQLDTTVRVERRVLVSTRGLSRQSFTGFIEVQGNVTTAEEPAMASSETGGRLIELLVKEGDYVKQGQLLGKVNLESILKSIAEIDKALELATDIYKRQESLWKQNIGSEVQYLQSKNQVESLQKSKERLEFELSKANVYAPASGYVDKVMVKAGEMAGPGSPIVMILNTGALKVKASVPENYLKNVNRGETVRLNFPALELEQTGRISDISRTINPANRTFDIEVLLDSRGGLIKPNLLAVVQVKEFEIKDAITLPQELILQDISGKDYVMVKEGERAARRFVTLGRSYQNEVEVREGLKGDERILVKGARLAVDGDLLDVTEHEPNLAEKQQ